MVVNSGKLANENWVYESNSEVVKTAQILLDEIKRRRYTPGKKYILVKVDDNPPTYKEIYVGMEAVEEQKEES